MITVQFLKTMGKIEICVVLLFFININIALAEGDTEAPIVSLPQGQIQGHVLVSLQGDSYYAYQEIPYASPPVEELRFKEPVAPQNWTGVLNTTHNTHSCFLNGIDDERAPDVTESEDCLYLNVYTPVKPGSNSSIPVLFWIHGGGFLYGDGTFQVYGPQYLIDYDVVIVTINYRLGAFGFLTTQDDIIPGNLGLKDQIFALKWVQTNIKLFGGDPSKVTIVGESAGGSSIAYHIISEKSKGLFRGAILQSGTALCSFSLQRNAKYFAYKAGSILNAKFNSSSENSTALLEVLQNASAKDINNITIDIPDNLVMGVEKELVWAPVVEDAKYAEAFITGYMHEDIKSGNINKVPILIGYNSEEEILFIGDDDSVDSVENLAAQMDQDNSKIVNNMYNITNNKKNEAGHLLQQLYTDVGFDKNFSAIVRYLSDSKFTTPIIRHAQLQSHYTDVYLYQFSYKGIMGHTNITVDGVDAVGHAEDLKYLWHMDRVDDGSIYPVADRITRSRLLKLWTNFVKYLNPTPESDPLFENTIWPKIKLDEDFMDITYLNINRTLEVKTNPRSFINFTAIVDKYANFPLYTF